ncbi:MAG: 16S rRNA (cytidine(1402)-2'-O)-methyltransferase [Lachnospiraceae bacterium]|nr:16S rRNA (cytidine(1402)-2'-O)-methyltransferase [Lachnospiraceae bacterium]
MTGTLYLVATPIGNLEDMTYRAVRILSEADLIACEDTRTSGVLLARYGIRTPCISYHKFNEKTRGPELVGKLEDGQTIALISDAGMPAISDPGESLVCLCHEAGVPVSAVPGASAVVTALALSGRDSRRFSFEGFLPQDRKERERILEEMKTETRTLILYEAPHRLEKTLALLAEALGEERPITLCRELTKRYETLTDTTIGEALKELARVPARGEYVLVLEGRNREELEARKQEAYAGISLLDHVASYEAKGLSRKEAMKAAAKDRGLTRREVYQALLHEEETPCGE